MKHLDKKNLIIAALFAVFLFLRLFSSSPSFLLGADSLKYIEAAKTFPYHKLYNDQLYLLHPPFYPYAIYLVNLIFQDYAVTGLFISLFSSIVTFFVLYKFFMMLTGNFNITFFVLAFYTISVSFISYAKIIFKEAFVIMLIFFSLYNYVKGVKFNNKKSLITATIFGSLLAVTSDHIVFLFPSLILSYIFFNSAKINLIKLIFPNIKYAIFPLIVILLSYSLWGGIKFYQYAANEYYPNGLGGTPLSTEGLNLLKIISPTNFEDYNLPYTTPGPVSILKKIVYQFGYMFDIEPFSIPLGLNFTTMSFLLYPRHIVYMLLIYPPLSLIALFGFFSIIMDFIKTKRIYNNVNMYMVGLFFIFLFPLAHKMTSPRFIYTAYFFMFYFISYGLFILMRKRLLKFYPKLIQATIILLLILVPFWYYSNGYFVLSTKAVERAQNAGNFINDNIDKSDAIMAQPGYSVNLIHLTGRRIIGLHQNPEKLQELINYYDISYIVTGRLYTYYLGRYSKDSAEYVRDNPDKFELIATIPEDYSDFYAASDYAGTDEIYIYKVVKNT